MKATRPAGTYLYCLTYAGPFADGAPPLICVGIGGDSASPRVVRVADLAAIVCDSPYARYDVSRAYLLAHEEVVEEVMSRADVLPVRFGTVAESDEMIQEQVLWREARALHQQLTRVAGCVELGVKALWRPEHIFAVIAEGDATIRGLRDAVASLDPITAYSQRIELGELVADGIERLREQEAEWLLAALRPLVRETLVNPPQWDMMALNASFLVERANVGEFDARVAALRQQQQGRLTLKSIGPLPPYSFVDLALSGEGAIHGIVH